MSDAALEGPSDGVDVWMARIGELGSPTVAARFEPWLTPEESARRRAYVREVNRLEYLITRALVRSSLSRYRAVPPRAWRFGKNAYGRPHTEPGCGLQWNLSNTTALVVCAVSQRGEVGVDVEPLDRADDILEVAETVFSPRELGDLRALSDAGRRDRALDLWTLKESYIKARGMGLSLPLEKFSFLFDDPNEVRIAIDPALEDRDDRWTFRRLDVAGHRLSLAVERPRGEPLELRLRDVTDDLSR
jgi:4'-phosphopantetheinyl transferase